MTPRERSRIFDRAEGLCKLCGGPGSEIDHIRPRSSLPGKRLKAQRDHPDNLQLLCVMCHRTKKSNSWRD